MIIGSSAPRHEILSRPPSASLEDAQISDVASSHPCHWRVLYRSRCCIIVVEPRPLSIVNNGGLYSRRRPGATLAASLTTKIGKRKSTQPYGEQMDEQEMSTRTFNASIASIAMLRCSLHRSTETWRLMCSLLFQKSYTPFGSVMTIHFCAHHHHSTHETHDPTLSLP
jgi:hypothetical protein